jgi:prolyl-tRNA editing enzyme YbaK/EbsC (Cys-tRNA(Pro) deacylase)
VPLAGVALSAAEQFVARLRALGIAHELRRHEPARHARHLAALWQAALPEAGRATLFAADAAAVLCLVPADRKVSAPRLRDLLGAADLRVLRGDRGVGRIGWLNLPAPPGALPGVPGIYGARCLVDERVLALARLIVALDPGRSVRLRPDDYVRASGAAVARFTGSTRLLAGGGMVDDQRGG